MKKGPIGPFSLILSEFRGLITCVAKPQTGDSSRNIQARLCLHTQRLEIDILAEPTDQNIGTKARNNSSFSRGAAITALQRAALGWAGGKYGPDHHGLAGKADVDAELADRSGVMLGPCAARGLENAVNRLR